MMTQREVIDAIAALSAVADANKGFVTGSESTQQMANDKIKELIPLINKE